MEYRNSAVSKRLSGELERPRREKISPRFRKDSIGDSNRIWLVDASELSELNEGKTPLI